MSFAATQHFWALLEERRNKGGDLGQSNQEVALRSDRPFLKLNCDFNYICVRSFILTGAPFAYKTTNIPVRGLFAGNDCLQHVLAANKPDRVVVDLDGVDD